MDFSAIYPGLNNMLLSTSDDSLPMWVNFAPKATRSTYADFFQINYIVFLGPSDLVDISA